MRGKLEGIDLLEAGAIFLDHLAGGVGGACARQLDFHIRVFLLEAVDQRLDLRAGGIEEQAALAPGALLEDRLPVEPGVAGDGFDSELRTHAGRSSQRGEHRETEDCARSHPNLPDLLPEW